MCGIIGIHRVEGAASAELYEGLLMLQHRGQDSAGMVTFDGQRFMEKKDNGLVANIFDKKSIDSLEGTFFYPLKILLALYCVRRVPLGSHFPMPCEESSQSRFEDAPVYPLTVAHTKTDDIFPKHFRQHWYRARALPHRGWFVRHRGAAVLR